MEVISEPSGMTATHKHRTVHQPRHIRSVKRARGGRSDSRPPTTPAQPPKAAAPQQPPTTAAPQPPPGPPAPPAKPVHPAPPTASSTNRRPRAPQREEGERGEEGTEGDGNEREGETRRGQGAGGELNCADDQARDAVTVSVLCCLFCVVCLFNFCPARPPKKAPIKRSWALACTYKTSRHEQGM